jgi:hypothetical protein
LLTAALICFAIAALCLSAIGQDKRPPLSFRLAQSVYVAGEGIDWGLSYVAVTKMGYTELNGAAAWQLKNPTVGAVAVVAFSAAFTAITDLAWKQNRAVGWALVIAAVLVKGYVVARNIGTLGE